MITLGVDVGNLFLKAALMDDARLLAAQLAPATGEIEPAIAALIERALHEARIARDAVAYLVATGTGAELVPDAAFAEDEAVCVGAAVGFFTPQADLALHIGGQGISALRINGDGETVDFIRNDKCVAGAGRFLEMIARRLGLTLADFDRLAAEAQRSLSISAQCAVFAESEVITHLNNGERVTDVIAGVCEATADIVAAQARRFRQAKRFTATGGVARLNAVVSRVTRRLDAKYCPFPLDPTFAAAIGAAMLTRDG